LFPPRSAFATLRRLSWSRRDDERQPDVFEETWSAVKPEQEIHWMGEALALARRARGLGEVPVGAVVVRDGELLGSGFNRREGKGDPLAHAEMEAIAEARARVEGWRFEGCEMVVTLEPCAMCAGALVNSRFDGLVFGAADPKAGFCGSLGDLVRDPRLNHRLAVRRGVLAQECGSLLSEFFSSLRQRP
jgi:tRNA(adenine34) deaminase